MKTTNSFQRQAYVPGEKVVQIDVSDMYVWAGFGKILTNQFSIHQFVPPYFVLEFSCNGFLWYGITNSP